MEVTRLICWIRLTGIASIALTVGPQTAQSLNFSTAVGYFSDREELFVTAKIGKELASGLNFSHHLESELGLSRIGFREPVQGVPVSVTGKLTPVFVNYRVVTTAVHGTSIYFGAGFGGSRVTARTVSPGISVTDSDWVFSKQALGGLQFAASEAVSLLIGGRYVWFGEPTLFGGKVADLNDVGVELGFSYRF